jgi:sugar/nucleoside kinase (ribokinase family)
MSAARPKGGDRARRGICCSGNWIIDHVKTIDVWPEEEHLANILAEELGTGGAPYNVIVDLSRFDLGLELSALGLVGDDADGERILADCRARGIDTRHLRKVKDAPTAYTDVMTVRGSGRRTFFHNRGANALLGPEHFPLDELTCRILSLGYLLLLERMDAVDAEFGTQAARLLAGARERGILTAVDVVSEDSDRFASVVTPALPHADFLIVNEIEAGRTTGRDLRPGGRLDPRAVEAAAADLLEKGVRRLVVVHAAESCYGVARGSDGALERRWQPAHDLPAGFIRGTAGAGDAFFAGVLVGFHEGWPLSKSLRFANAAAASCLRHPTCTGGVGTAEEIWRLADTLPLRKG